MVMVYVYSIHDMGRDPALSSSYLLILLPILYKVNTYTSHQILWTIGRCLAFLGILNCVNCSQFILSLTSPSIANGKYEIKCQ